MLESSEVDVDFFTPLPNTSLATIFSNTQLDRNESLMYIPEAPVQPGGSHNNDNEMQKSSSKCVFATSVSAYEWITNEYKLREKLGFAIIQDLKDDIHHLIIYTSEKHTLSMATIASKFIVKVKKGVNISYYDNYKRYWLISSLPSKITEIVKYLEILNVNIELLNNEQTSLEVIKEKSNSTEFSFENKESDTDSAVCKKNKNSILRRMATMGQSVLPPNKNITSKSTDSTDTNEDEHPPIQRHKPTKSKRNTVEKNVLLGFQNNNETGKIFPNTVEIQNSSDVKPETISNMNLEPNIYDNNMINIISEQRINNSELRININRLSDRIEELSKNVSCGQINNQNDIITKLLKEYEKKIMSYEKFIKLKGLECNLIFITDDEVVSSVSKKSNESENQQQCGNQDLEINELNKKIDILTAKSQNQCEILHLEIDVLKQDLIQKDMILKSIDKNIQELTASSHIDDYSNKLKNIMNSTYQTISVQFNDDDDYKGSMVKNIVAKIIKKITMECLNDI